MRLLSLAVYVHLVACSFVAAGESRTWTSKDGNFTIVAELDGFGAKGI
jgi:hypothetical protein